MQAGSQQALPRALLWNSGADSHLCLRVTHVPETEKDRPGSILLLFQALLTCRPASDLTFFCHRGRELATALANLDCDDLSTVLGAEFWICVPEPSKDLCGPNVTFSGFPAPPGHCPPLPPTSSCSQHLRCLYSCRASTETQANIADAWES